MTRISRTILLVMFVTCYSTMVPKADGYIMVCFDTSVMVQTGPGMFDFEWITTRDWYTSSTSICEDILIGGTDNVACYEWGADAPDPPAQEPGVVTTGLHPQFDGSSTLGTFGDVTVVMREDLPPTAVRENGGVVEFATLVPLDQDLGDPDQVLWNTRGHAEVPLLIPPRFETYSNIPSHNDIDPVAEDFAVVITTIDEATQSYGPQHVFEFTISELNFQPVPEPTTLLLALVGVLGFRRIVR